LLDGRAPTARHKRSRRQQLTALFGLLHCVGRKLIGNQSAIGAIVLAGVAENVQVGFRLLPDTLEIVMSTGTVKWFNPTKGYGFIQPQGGGQDVFVHISAVERAGLSTLNEGQQVEFEVVSNRGKSSAENLKVK
jgi:cold shock protein